MQGVDPKPKGLDWLHLARFLVASLENALDLAKAPTHQQSDLFSILTFSLKLLQKTNEFQDKRMVP